MADPVHLPAGRAQPWLTGWPRRHQDEAHSLGPRTMLSLITAFFATLTGVYVGARIGRKLPLTLFRMLIVAAGVTAAVAHAFVG